MIVASDIATSLQPPEMAKGRGRRQSRALGRGTQVARSEIQHRFEQIEGTAEGSRNVIDWHCHLLTLIVTR